MKHNILHKFFKQSDEGQGLVEYALILVLVAVVVIVILSVLGPSVGNIFSDVVAALDGGGAVGAADEEKSEAACLWDGMLAWYDFAEGVDILGPNIQNYNSNTCSTPLNTHLGYSLRGSAFSEKDAEDFCTSKGGKGFYKLQDIYWCPLE